MILGRFSKREAQKWLIAVAFLPAKIIDVEIPLFPRHFRLGLFAIIEFWYITFLLAAIMAPTTDGYHGYLSSVSALMGSRAVLWSFCGLVAAILLVRTTCARQALYGAGKPISPAGGVGGPAYAVAIIALLFALGDAYRDFYFHETVIIVAIAFLLAWTSGVLMLYEEYVDRYNSELSRELTSLMRIFNAFYEIGNRSFDAEAVRTILRGGDVRDIMHRRLRIWVMGRPVPPGLREGDVLDCIEKAWRADVEEQLDLILLKNRSVHKMWQRQWLIARNDIPRVSAQVGVIAVNQLFEDVEASILEQSDLDSDTDDMDDDDWLDD